jgi:uncharacterized cupredoxin-like copper-binding protein
MGVLVGCAKDLTATNPLSANSQSGSTAEQPWSSSILPVELSEYHVQVPTTITAGVKVLEITDAGTMQHELLVFHPDSSINPTQLPVDSTGNVIEDAPGINKITDGPNLNPGDVQFRSIDLSTPGTYVFLCNLPGHYKLGMVTIVNVVPAPSGVTTTQPLFSSNDVPITLNDFDIDVPLMMTTGVKTLDITNASDTNAHNLLVFRPASTIDPNRLPVDSKGDVNASAPGINEISSIPTLQSGDYSTPQINLSTPGTYVFVSNLPGDYQKRVARVVTVVTPPSTTS